MTYPTKYTRQYDFQSYQGSNPTRPLPGDKVNVDLNAVNASISEIVEFLKTSIRADGRLATGSVGVNQLDATFNIGFSLPTTWEPGIAYTTDSTVFHNNKFYLSNVAHTSSDGFDESKWDVIVDFGAEADAAADSATASAASATAAAASATSAAASATASAASATSADTTADAAAASATAAATSATNAATSATNAATSATSAATTLDSFDDRYLGAKAADPTLDNDGDALLTGVLYWNTGDNALKVYDGAAWQSYNPAPTFLQAGTSAVSRTFQDKMRDVVHVKDFGAKADYTTVTATVSITSGAAALTATGAAFTSADVGKLIAVPGAGAAGGILNTTIAAFTDATHITLTANAGTTVSAVSKTVSYATNDQAAIQAALNTGKVVRLPYRETCAVSGTLTMVNAGGIVGEHAYQTALVSFSTNAALISVPDNASHLTIGNFGLFRAVTATSGGDGIAFLGSTALTVIDNMWIEGQWNGVALCHTATSRISNMIITNNINNGLQMLNKSDQTGYQWLMDNILCQMNGGHGFLVTSIACSMAGGNSCANMTRLASFANNGKGFYAAGLSAVPINGLRISSSFFGEDGSDEVLLDTYGATHVFTHVYTEIAGTRTTGPTLAVAASNVGSGFNFTTNNTDIELVNCISKGNSVYGLVSQAASLAIIGGAYTYNGAAAAQPGIFIRAGKNRVVGARSGGTPQTYGIVIDAAAIDIVYTGCDLTGNSGGAAFSSSSGTVKIGDNLP